MKGTSMKLIQGAGLAAVTATGVLAFTALPASADGVGHARVLRVAPGHSIQAAVDRAHPGDTIKLAPGNYAGGILISKNNITIRGAGRSTVLHDTGTNHCAAIAGPTGICVVAAGGGTVRGVTIKNLQVRRFGAFGVFGFGTDRLTVTGVAAVNNGEYGITEFASTRGSFIGNVVTGSTGEAGLYVGDTPDAHGTTVADNVSIGNALGVLVRHAHNVNIRDNTFVGNCAGVALVDDGQAGGQGDTRVTGNVIVMNNRACPGSTDAPPLGGSGVIIFGGQRDTVRDNAIIGNRGDPATSPLAGGVVLVRGQLGNAAKHNKVVSNVILRNRPADVIDHSGSTTNVIRNNICRTSQPGGLCKK
jgi:nitrous oxidase accessory protein NosD